MQPIQEHLFETATPAEFVILLENRLEFIKNSVKDKISTAHDPESAKLSSDKIVDTIANKIDPTTRKSHTEWLVNRYKQGDFKLSDAKNVKKHLETFEKSASYLPNSDIKSYKTMSDLQDAVAATTMRREAEAPKIEREAAAVNMPPEVFNQDGVHGYKLENKESSIRLYGPNGKAAKTTWCTASEGHRNMFEGYSGGKYPLHLPNGRVLQIHHTSNQLKDERNREINLDTDEGYKPYRKQIEHFIKHTGELEGLTADKSQLMSRYAPIDAEKFDKNLSDYAAMREHAKHLDHVPYDVDIKLRNLGDVIAEKSKKVEITPERFHAINNTAGWDFFNSREVPFRMQRHLAENKHLSTEQVGEMVEANANTQNAATSENSNTLENLAKHPNISDIDLHKIIGRVTASEHLQYANVKQALRYESPNMKPEHFARLAPNNETKLSILDSSVSKHKPREWYDEFVATRPHTIAGSENLPADVSQHIINAHVKDSGHVRTMEKLLDNESVPHEQKLQIVKEHPYSLKVPARDFIEHPQASPESVNALVSRYNTTGLEGSNDWLPSNRLSREHIHSIINGPHDINQHVGILQNPKIRSPELSMFAKHANISPFAADAILEHPYLKAANVDELLANDKIKPNVTLSIASATSKAIEPRHVTEVLNTPGLRFNDRISALNHVANVPAHFHQFENDPRMHGAISNSRNAPPSVLHKLAFSPMEHVRQNVAENPNTSPETLDILKTDANPSIVAAASKRRK